MRMLVLLLFFFAEVIAMQALWRSGGALLLLGWLLIAAALGVGCIRQIGLSTLRSVQLALQRHELPALPLWEAFLGLIAGILLLLPGPVGDLCALPLLLPTLRRHLSAWLHTRYAQKHPGMRSPVVLDGEYRETTRRQDSLPPD